MSYSTNFYDSTGIKLEILFLFLSGNGFDIGDSREYN